MITLTINGENRDIPTMDELTVKQYTKFIKKDLNIVSYISACLGIDFKEAAGTRYKNFEKLMKRLGTIQDYTKIKPSNNLLVGKEVFKLEDIEINTVGQRFMIEENTKKMKAEEFFCYVLAIGLVPDYMNSDKVNRMKRKLMGLPYKTVLPTAFFLALRSKIGRRNATNYLQMLNILISMKLNGSRQALRNWVYISIITRFRRFRKY